MSQKYAHTDADGRVIGFYAEDIHGEKIPAGSIAISDEQHQELMAGQDAGKHMHVAKDGTHSLRDRPPLTTEQLAETLRAERNAALAATDSLVARHRDEAEDGGKTTLTAPQYTWLQEYRKALRNLPAQKDFPRCALPAAPDFIGAK